MAGIGNLPKNISLENMLTNMGLRCMGAGSVSGVLCYGPHVARSMQHGLYVGANWPTCFLASQDALEVMSVSESVTPVLETLLM